MPVPAAPLPMVRCPPAVIGLNPVGLAMVPAAVPMAPIRWVWPAQMVALAAAAVDRPPPTPAAAPVPRALARAVRAAQPIAAAP